MAVLNANDFLYVLGFEVQVISQSCDSNMPAVVDRVNNERLLQQLADSQRV
ncbi:MULTISPECIES: hypothetical protein [Nocardiopsis]|uniref:Uncharacterized protein n=1 Tax=Nocardiopsis akebiae TaxID=2831968 RepID=A0ABX8C2V7_9ACTN|nr:MULTISPECIES: hypothetical protein [Nocardiopsis]QUX26918.1 hypothetical protein KGD83_16265 [Nocardiopsis akebiae]